MDRIHQFDWGVYSHFDFLGQQDSPLFRAGYQVSGYLGVGILLVIAVLLFLVQGKFRSVLACLLSSALAVGIIRAVHWLVPRPRPDKAVDIVGPENMVGSYPSAAVFLFMLGMILLGFAIWSLSTRAWLRGLYVLVAALLTVWVCVSQFFLALHFLTDVLGGIAGATLVGWIAYRFLESAPPTAPTVPPIPSDAFQDLSHQHGIQKK